MTVQELRLKLANAPDDMNVVILREDTTLGGFFFEPACSEDSGVTALGKPDENAGEVGEGGKVFMLSICQCEHEETTKEKLN
jgi:hypothetical protein